MKEGNLQLTTQMYVTVRDYHEQLYANQLGKVGKNR